MQQPSVLFADEHLKVACFSRPDTDTKQTLVSFTGVGHALNGIDVQKPEFFKSGEGYSTILFVMDLKRSWGNSLDLPRLRDLLSRYVEEGPVDTLGNSMGGFLSLLAPSLFPVRRAVAIVPQISVHPDIVPWEKRWMKYRGQIKSWALDSVADRLVAGTAYKVIVGSHPSDVAQAGLLPDVENLETLAIPDVGHNVAAKLKERGLLDSFVKAALTENNLNTWASENLA